MIPTNIDDLYKKVFGDEDGKKVLDDLCMIHYIHTTTQSRKNSQYEIIAREGERRVVLRILDILKDKKEI